MIKASDTEDILITASDNLNGFKDTLEDFTRQWESRYSYAIKIWRDNWLELTVFFEFLLEIRKIIYTTNLIDILNKKN